MSQGEITAAKPMQQRKQQRQILQMMGITQWIRPHAPVIALSDINDDVPRRSALSDSQSTSLQTSDMAHATQQSEHHSSANPEDSFGTASVTAPSQTSSTESSSSFTDVLLNEANDHPSADGHIIHDQATDDSAFYTDSVRDDLVNDGFVDEDFTSLDNHVTADTIYHFDRLDTDSDGSDITENAPDVSTAYQRLSAAPVAGNQQKVAAFDLQGGCYRDWVIMVDVRQLSAETKTLWQNLTQALGITCQNNAFPLCPDMDTLELANASVAGYVFRLGRQENIKVAALTALPKGVTQPNIQILPTLQEMLDTPEQKRIFWQRLNEEDTQQ